MLGAYPATATVAVKDLDAARRYYTEKLGLEVAHADSEVVVFKAGAGQLFVYRSQFAGTNLATAVTWSMGAQLEAEVKALAGRGIRFEHYDLPGLTRKGDVHVGEGLSVAWFKDPDGNIHSLMSAETGA